MFTVKFMFFYQSGYFVSSFGCFQLLNHDVKIKNSLGVDFYVNNKTLHSPDREQNQADR